MGWFSFLDPILNSILGPLLTWDPLYAIATISFVMSLVLTLAYKFFTDQNLMKDLKDQIKEFQKQVKELKEKPEEMMAVQKKMMEVNMKYMMHSMRPTLITFIPIILIFGWLQATMGFVPIVPGAEFTVTTQFTSNGEALLEVAPTQGIELLTDEKQPIVDNQAQWGLKGEKGKYQVTVTQGDVKQTHNIKIDELYYNEPISKFKDSSISSIETNHDKLIVMNIFGWKLGWLGSYLILSILMSVIMRKMMRVY